MFWILHRHQCNYSISDLFLGNHQSSKVDLRSSLLRTFRLDLFPLALLQLLLELHYNQLLERILFIGEYTHPLPSLHSNYYESSSSPQPFHRYHNQLEVLHDPSEYHYSLPSGPHFYSATSSH